LTEEDSVKVRVTLGEVNSTLINLKNKNPADIVPGETSGRHFTPAANPIAP
jgi:hypothetical protein